MRTPGCPRGRHHGGECWESRWGAIIYFCHMLAPKSIVATGWHWISFVPWLRPPSTPCPPGGCAVNRASRRAARKGGPKGPAGGVFEIARREDLEHFCAFLASAKAPQLPLVRAAADLRINLAIIAFPELARPGARATAISARPTVVLIGDDVDGRPARVPRDWPCAPAARQWAATAIVHGTGGLPEHYREAVRAAELTKVVV